jgi:acetyl-CoA carboxylase biotin carboxyl carrier protein
MTSEETIDAPMPGVFYRRPDPDEPVFVEEGDDVSAGETVGLIGVMKTFHDIEPGTDCVVTSFEADNETEVEAGDTLVTVEPE